MYGHLNALDSLHVSASAVLDLCSRRRMLVCCALVRSCRVRDVRRVLPLVGFGSVLFPCPVVRWLRMVGGGRGTHTPAHIIDHRTCRPTHCSPSVWTAYMVMITLVYECLCYCIPQASRVWGDWPSQGNARMRAYIAHARARCLRAGHAHILPAAHIPHTCTYPSYLARTPTYTYCTSVVFSVDV